MQKYRYLQLFYSEVNGILFYQGFPWPILPTKHPCYTGLLRLIVFGPVFGFGTFLRDKEYCGAQYSG